MLSQCEIYYYALTKLLRNINMYNVLLNMSMSASFIERYQHIRYGVANIRDPYGANVYFVGTEYPTQDWHRVYVPPQKFRTWVLGLYPITRNTKTMQLRQVAEHNDI